MADYSGCGGCPPSSPFFLTQPAFQAYFKCIKVKIKKFTTTILMTLLFPCFFIFLSLFLKEYAKMHLVGKPKPLSFQLTFHHWAWKEEEEKEERETIKEGNKKSPLLRLEFHQTPKDIVFPTLCIILGLFYSNYSIGSIKYTLQIVLHQTT